MADTARMVSWIVTPLPLILVAVLILNMRRPAKVSVRIDGEQLIVELRGWDVFYCCRRRVVVPLNEVEGVGVFPRDMVPRQGLRLPGAAFPGVIRAGSFGIGAKRDFWDVRTGAQLLVVQLKPGAAYRRLVLELPDPQEQLRRLRPILGPLEWATA